jgi:hypothetical protein
MLSVVTIVIREYIELSSYVTSNCLAVVPLALWVPQSCKKTNKKHCTVYHIALNSKREAQKESKNLKKNVR